MQTLIPAYRGNHQRIIQFFLLGGSQLETTRLQPGVAVGAGVPIMCATLEILGPNGSNMNLM
jgi:hypothetical protein